MKRKKSNIYIILIVLVLLGVSLGYAAMNKLLSITGTSQVVTNSWDLRFENIVVKKGSVETLNPPSIDDDKDTVSFDVSLGVPGDFYEFTVDVRNAGSIDAVIDSVVKTPELTEVQKKYLNYVIEYQGGADITANQVIPKEDFVRLRVLLEYRTDITENDLPVDALNSSLSFTLNCLQDDGTGIPVKNHGLVHVDGDLNQIGTIVTIGTEKFYTMGTEGDNVKLFPVLNVSATDYDDEFVFQDVSAYSLPFSNSTYQGEYYCDYNGSVVELFVNKYKHTLELYFGVDVADVRLITIDELTDPNTFACVDAMYQYCIYSPYEWIHSTTYWTGEDMYPNMKDAIMVVTSSGSLIYYEHNGSAGLRPVVVVAKSIFE